MAGTTPTYGFRYQTVSDVPNGAVGLQNLATDVENKIITVDASILSHVPTQLEAVANADKTINTATEDITGATLIFNTTVANTIAVIEATFDWRLTVLGTGYCYGEVSIDGSVNGRKSLFVAQNAETRLPGILRIRTTLASVGSHTIKLVCHKDAGTGTALFCGNTTVLSVDLYQYA